MRDTRLFNKVYGCLLGGLIGDAMGAPVEGWHYTRIEKEHGQVDGFKGEGTDDSAIKLILCKAILDHGGHVGPDEFATAFLQSRDKYNLFFVPVRNMFHKLESRTCPPVDAGAGNMPSSSSAMSISPMGLINACNPRQAALETFSVAGLIHSGVTGFCRDAACAMAAAVAEAMKPGATVAGVLHAATAYLNQTSAAEMRANIDQALAMARQAKDYRKFRALFYKRMTREIMCDSRETVPAALALFMLAKGDPTQAILYAANFGRDADTIATMSGSLAGAFQGVHALRRGWVQQIAGGKSGQRELANALIGVLRQRVREDAATVLAFRKLELHACAPRVKPG